MDAARADAEGSPTRVQTNPGVTRASTCDKWQVSFEGGLTNNGLGPSSASVGAVVFIHFPHVLSAEAAVAHKYNLRPSAVEGAEVFGIV